MTVQILRAYKEKEFLNVTAEKLDLTSDEEKEELNKKNESEADLLKFMKDSIGDKVTKVQFTASLAKHPVCLSTEGALSVGMEKVLNSMPGAEDQHIKAETVMEINVNHPITEKLKALFESDKDKFASYAKILYSQAQLISGLSPENPSEIADLICDLML